MLGENKVDLVYRVFQQWRQRTYSTELGNPMLWVDSPGFIELAQAGIAPRVRVELLSYCPEPRGAVSRSWPAPLRGELWP